MDIHVDTDVDIGLKGPLIDPYLGPNMELRGLIARPGPTGAKAWADNQRLYGCYHNLGVLSKGFRMN